MDSEPIENIKSNLTQLDGLLHRNIEYNNSYLCYLRRRIVLESESHKAIYKLDRQECDALSSLKKQGESRTSDSLTGCLSLLIQKRKEFVVSLNSEYEKVEEYLSRMYEIDQVRRKLKSQWESKSKDYANICQEHEKLRLKYEKARQDQESKDMKKFQSISTAYVTASTQYNLCITRLFHEDMPLLYESYEKSLLASDMILIDCLEMAKRLDKEIESICKLSIYGWAALKNEATTSNETQSRQIRESKVNILVPEMKNVEQIEATTMAFIQSMTQRTAPTASTTTD